MRDLDPQKDSQRVGPARARNGTLARTCEGERRGRGPVRRADAAGERPARARTRRVARTRSFHGEL